MSKYLQTMAKQNSESLSISKQQLEQNRLLFLALTGGDGVRKTLRSSDQQDSHSNVESMDNFLLNCKGSNSSSFGSAQTKSLFSHRPSNAKSFQDQDIVVGDPESTDDDSTDSESLPNLTLPILNENQKISKMPVYNKSIFSLIPKHLQPSVDVSTIVRQKKQTSVQQNEQTSVQQQEQTSVQQQEQTSVQQPVPVQPSTSANRRIDEILDQSTDTFTAFEMKYQTLFEGTIPKALWNEKISILKVTGYRDELHNIDGKFKILKNQNESLYLT